MTKHFSQAVVHNYNRDYGTEQSFSDLSGAGFDRLGVEVDIGSVTSEEVVVIDRVADTNYLIEAELPKIAEAYSGPIILDITERRAWPQVDALIQQFENSLSYDQFCLAIGSVICSYFGEPNSQEEKRYTLPKNGFGFVTSYGSLKEAELLHSTNSMNKLFWLPDPRGTEDLIHFVRACGTNVELFYFLPFTSPATRLGGAEPTQVLTRDLELLESAGIHFTPIGKREDLIRFREIVDQVYAE